MEHNTPFFKDELYIATLLKEYSLERRQVKTELMAERPYKHQFSQMIKVNLNNNIILIADSIYRYIFLNKWPHPGHMEIPRPGVELQPL